MADDKREESSSSLLAESLRDFSGYTTLHGLHFVFGTNGTLRRLIWMVLILTGLGICTRQLIVSYDKLQARDHVISKEIIPSDKLTFPAVTFCNVNMLRKRYMQGTNAQLYLDQLNVLKRVALPNAFVNKTLSTSFDIEESVRDAGHSARSMVQTCSWNGESCGYSNFSTFFSHTYGLCHTFNPGRNGHPLLSSTSIKKSRGLVLLIDIDYSDYYGINSYFNAGIRLVIHDQNEAPMVEVNGLDIMPSLTSIKIQRNEYENLKSPFKSACDTRKLETSKVYTRSVCLQECQTRKIITHCGCKLLGMPDLKEFNGTKYCSPDSMFSCGLLVNVSGYRLEDVKEVMTEYYVKLDDPFLSDNPENDCDCPKPCNEVKYQIKQLNSVTLLSKSFWKEYAEMQIINSHTETESERKKFEQWMLQEEYKIRNSYLVIIVHYDELHIHKTTERKAYDVNDFGSDVGGYIGLFLGCSILTVFEMLDFILFLCFTGSKSKKSVVITVQRQDVVEEEL